MESIPDQTKKPLPEGYWREPMAVFARVTGWIAIPVVAALFIGRYLDARWGTAPWAFLATTGIAFIISCIGIVLESKKYLSKIEQEHGKHTDNNSTK